jgi:WD40 repeat protein
VRVVTVLMVCAYAVCFALVLSGAVRVTSPDSQVVSQRPGKNGDAPQPELNRPRSDEAKPKTEKEEQPAGKEEPKAQAGDREKQRLAYLAAEKRLMEKLTEPRADYPTKEWDVLERRSSMVIARLAVPYAKQAALSPNGQTLAVTTSNRDDSCSVQMWDLRTGKLRHDLPGHSSDKAAAFSPDSRTLATVWNDKTVRLWDVQTGKQKLDLTGHKETVKWVAFSPAGQIVATWDEEDFVRGKVRLWNAASGAEMHPRRPPPRTGNSPLLAFRPDGRALALVDSRNKLCLWEVETGELSERTFDASGAIGLVFAPDGKAVLLMRRPEEHPRLCDLTSGTVREIKDHKDWVRAGAFSPDGKWLAGKDGSDLVLWDLATGKERCRVREYDISGLSFFPGGSLLIGWYGTVSLYHVADLLDDKLLAAFRAVDKIGKVRRKGLAFHVRLGGNAKEEALAHLKNLRPLYVLDMEDAKHLTDASLARLEPLSEVRHLVVNSEVTETGLAQVGRLTRLESLDLSHCGIVTDTGLGQLKGLTNLAELNLHRAQVTRTGLAHLQSMKKLRRLHLAECSIGDEGLAVLARITQLEDLDLNDVGITDAGLACLKSLTSLTRLVLSYNDEVKGKGFVHLEELKSLRELNLCGPAFDDAGLAHLKGLTRLVNLNLDGTALTNAGLVAIKDLKALRTLHLPDKVNDAGLVHLAGLTNLSSVIWKDEGITGQGLAHLGGLTKVTKWDLSRTGLTDEGLAHIRRWTHVVDLNLPERITDAGLVHLEGLVNLERLDLSETKVTDAGLVHLRKLVKLKFLDLRKTSVTYDGGIDPLKKALPNVYVNK